jgi:RTX calcium-binding nonapeptide repeat (4 copies)
VRVPLAAAALLVLALAAVPVAAQAHSSIARQRGTRLIYEQFRAKPELQKNTLTVSDGSGNLAGFFLFTDPTTRGIVNSPPCVPLDGKDLRVVCPEAEFTSLLILTKVGNDRVVMKTDRPATVRGGDGRDTIIGGPGREKLYGDAGDDRLVAGRNGGALLDGGAGSDVLDARNGKKDTIVACAADAVKRDAIDVVKSGC